VEGLEQLYLSKYLAAMFCSLPLCASKAIQLFYLGLQCMKTPHQNFVLPKLEKNLTKSIWETFTSMKMKRLMLIHWINEEFWILKGWWVSIVCTTLLSIWGRMREKMKWCQTARVMTYKNLNRDLQGPDILPLLLNTHHKVLTHIRISLLQS